MTPDIAALFDLDARVAVVTGASSGIGRAMAGALAGAGANVVLVARREAALAETAGEIRGLGVDAATVPGDLAARERVPEIAAGCRDAFGGVDVVVNAAGVNLREPPDAITPESWDAVLDLNLAAPFFFTRELVPSLRERGRGRVINLASLQSSRAFPGGIAYGASKGGLAQLTRAMAEAWSPEGITCNAIAPGFFPTALAAPIFSDPERERWAAGQTAMGRNGRLEDLAGATVFLASDASAYVTGQILHVDGGFTAK